MSGEIDLIVQAADESMRFSIEHLEKEPERFKESEDVKESVNIII